MGCERDGAKVEKEEQIRQMGVWEYYLALFQTELPARPERESNIIASCKDTTRP
jgi:hypothetical protein